MRLIGFLLDQGLRQVGYLFPWIPVFLGGGVGAYFHLKFEPFLIVFLAGFCGLLALFLAPLAKILVRAALIGIAAFCLGFVLAAVRSHSVAETVLPFRYYGPVEGRIIEIDRSASDAVRLTLDQVVLLNTPPSRTPARVRIALHGDQSHFEPLPGETIMTAAHLSPPSGPVEPGGFDFQRHAWFQRLGAVGYTRSPVMVLQPSGGSLFVFQLRHKIADYIRDAIPRREGEFAVAVITGDRSGISQDALEDLRASNLAHLLAISGLHMGMLTGVVFASIRGGLALVPRLAMSLPAKSISAAGALTAATGYLVLSGGAIATERAYVMVVVALFAVMMKRRAITIRAVAVAAIIVVVLSPEAILSPGFQMSFAATTALVAVFAFLREKEWTLGPKWLRPVIALVVSSAVAGLATAPFGAAHFNQISQYGLLANLLSVPVMGMIVVPGSVLAALLAPFGLAWIGLEISSLGLFWILFVADWIAGLDGAIRMVPQPDRMVLPLLSVGALVVALLIGPIRWLGFSLIIWALVLWGLVERPYILVSDNGGIVGVMTAQGRALSKGRGSGFIADVWLENDGDPADQTTAFERWGGQILHVTGKKSIANLTDCKGRDYIVLNDEPSKSLPCLVISPNYLKGTGSLAISKEGVITSSRDFTGSRIWHRWSNDQ